MKKSKPSSKTLPSYWLRDAIKTSMNRAPLDLANEAEYLAMLFAKRAQEQAEQAMAWLTVQRAAGRRGMTRLGGACPLD